MRGSHLVNCYLAYQEDANPRTPSPPNRTSLEPRPFLSLNHHSSSDLQTSGPDVWRSEVGGFFLPSIARSEILWALGTLISFVHSCRTSGRFQTRHGSSVAGEKDCRSCLQAPACAIPPRNRARSAVPNGCSESFPVIIGRSTRNSNQKSIAMVCTISCFIGKSPPMKGQMLCQAGNAFGRLFSLIRIPRILCH